MSKSDINAVVVENEKIGEKYYYFKHESGLDIYIIPQNHTTVYAMFATKYGSIDSIFRQKDDKEYIEVPDGIAHFLEHKLFENEDGVDTFKRYAETGASANAYTSFDKTAYLFSCTQNFDKSLEILLDFVSKPYFTDKTVEKEQGIISQEIRMYDDDPGWQRYFGMLGALYKNHSVRKDIAGTVESISKITAEILYKCYNTFYNLNNMALVIAGDVTVEQVNAVADKTLKKSPPIEIERYDYKEPAEINQKRVEKKLKVSTPLISIGIKDPDVGYGGNALAKKIAEIDIINDTIFGKAGAFYSKFYNEGLINNNFGAGAECSPEYGNVSIGGETKDPDRLYNEVFAEIDRIAEKGLDEKDFERSKRVVYGRSIMTFNSTQNIANSFLGCLFDGYNLFDLPEIISGVTFDDVKKRFQIAFNKENSVVSIVYPID